MVGTNGLSTSAETWMSNRGLFRTCHRLFIPQFSRLVVFSHLRNTRLKEFFPPFLCGTFICPSTVFWASWCSSISGMCVFFILFFTTRTNFFLPCFRSSRLLLGRTFLVTSNTAHLQAGGFRGVTVGARSFRWQMEYALRRKRVGLAYL